MEYNDCMLDWSNDDNFDLKRPWMIFPEAFIRDINSTNTFRKNDIIYDNSQYPQIVFDAIKDALPYYQKLYQQRVKID